jgi:HK97 family phage major capsid protein
VAASNLTVGRVNLSYKKLVAETVVSNDLLRFGGAESDSKIQDDLLRVVALREDRAFLLGNPPVDAGSPQGIRYQTAAANVFAAGGTALSNYQADLTKAVRLVEESDVDISSARWIMSPGQYWAIYALATTAGDWVFAQGLQQGSMLGFPVSKTSQLKESRLAAWGYGTSGTAGMILFIAPMAMEIHDSMQRSIEAFRGGAYTSAGSLVSGAETDETVIVCQSEHDFLQTYDTAAAIITGYAS